MTSTDLDLLQAYAREGSEAAFGELVRRHLNLVYSAALRQVRSPELAEEVAQSVFADLARSVDKLKPDTLLSAWLYQVTRRTAVDVIRRESRRQQREQFAVEVADMKSDAPEWSAIAPFLDEAMAGLEPADRDAILLRYFENKDLREVGGILGTSADAAQKRVSRALEKLRSLLMRRGITTSAAMLSLVLTAHTVQSAPTGLCAATSTAALSGVTLHSGAAIATKTIAMTTLQKTLVTVALVAAAGTAVYENRQVANLNESMQSLRQEQAALIQTTDQARRERDEAKAGLSALQQDTERVRSAATDIPRLRGEVARLREQNKQLIQAKAVNQPQASDQGDSFIQSVLSMASQAIELKQLAQQMPDKAIPEFQYLTANDWLQIVKNLDGAQTNLSPRAILRDVRWYAKQKVFSMLQQGLREYATANEGDIPKNVMDLKPYFKPPVSDDVLARYQIMNTGKLDDYDWMRRGLAAPPDWQKRWIIEEKDNVDPGYDYIYQIGLGLSARRSPP